MCIHNTDIHELGREIGTKTIEVSISPEKRIVIVISALKYMFQFSSFSKR